MVQKRKKNTSQRGLCEVLTLYHFNQRVLRSPFPRPDVATVLHFDVIVYVGVELQDGQAAAWGKRRKAVIRDISGVDH